MNNNYSEWTNVTTVDEHVTSSEHARYTITVVCLVLLGIACVLGIPGNAFVIWIAGVKMKKTVITIWYVNLAVADLLCLLTTPFFMVHIVLTSWPYGAAMCKILPAIVSVTMFSSVFTLTLISLDRLVLVIWSVWAQNHSSISRARLLCGLAWFLALLPSLPYLIYREIVEKSNRTICVYTNLSIFILSRFVVGFLIPLLVITVCYLIIARRVSVGGFKSQKALQIMLGVVTAFFICWMPFHAAGLVIVYGEESLGKVALAVYVIAVSVACINSCLNPVLYVFMGHDFKERVTLSLHRIFENTFNKDK